MIEYLEKSKFEFSRFYCRTLHHTSVARVPDFDIHDQIIPLAHGLVQIVSKWNHRNEHAKLNLKSNSLLSSSSGICSCYYILENKEQIFYEIKGITIHDQPGKSQVL